MAEQKEPVPFRENKSPSHPPRQHHKSNTDRDQKERVGAFPNQYFTDVHLPVVHHRTRSAPSFISCACPVALSNRDWKSRPPSGCCQTRLCRLLSCLVVEVT